MINKILNKIIAFNKGKRVMISKAWKDLTEAQQKTVKHSLDKQGNIKTFVRVKVTDLKDI